MRRSCQTMARPSGRPLARSQTSVVSRWLVMPMAAIAPGARPARSMRGAAGGGDARPDVVRVVLDPARLREVLRELLLRGGDHSPGARRRRWPGSRSCPGRWRERGSSRVPPGPSGGGLPPSLAARGPRPARLQAGAPLAGQDAERRAISLADAVRPLPARPGRASVDATRARPVAGGRSARTAAPGRYSMPSGSPGRSPRRVSATDMQREVDARRARPAAVITSRSLTTRAFSKRGADQRQEFGVGPVGWSRADRLSAVPAAPSTNAPVHDRG